MQKYPCIFAVENFISDLLNGTIVKPIIEACTGYDLISGEDHAGGYGRFYSILWCQQGRRGVRTAVAPDVDIAGITVSIKLGKYVFKDSTGQAIWINISFDDEKAILKLDCSTSFGKNQCCRILKPVMHRLAWLFEQRYSYNLLSAKNNKKSQIDNMK